jgi:hypothetical protein
MIQVKKSVVTFEDFMVVTINITESTAFKVLMLCDLEKAWHSGVIYCLHPLRSKSKTRKKAAEAGACWFLACFTLWPWEMSGFLWRMWHFNPEQQVFHHEHSENLKSSMNIAIFWAVASCNLVDGSEESGVSIFYPEDRGSIFLWNIENQITRCHNSEDSNLQRNPLIFLVPCKSLARTLSLVKFRYFVSIDENKRQTDWKICYQEFTFKTIK